MILYKSYIAIILGIITTASGIVCDEAYLYQISPDLKIDFMSSIIESKINTDTFMNNLVGVPPESCEGTLCEGTIDYAYQFIKYNHTNLLNFQLIDQKKTVLTKRLNNTPIYSFDNTKILQNGNDIYFNTCVNQRGGWPSEIPTNYLGLLKVRLIVLSNQAGNITINIGEYPSGVNNYVECLCCQIKRYEYKTLNNVFNITWGVNYIDTYINFIPTFTQDGDGDPGLCEVHLFAPFIQFTPFKRDGKIIVDVNVIEWKFLEYFYFRICAYPN